MKTILVPTDFSVAAQMASQYAAALARATRAQLVLLHTYHVPVSYQRVSGKAVRAQRLEKQQGKKLEVFRRELAEAYGIEAKTLVMPGLAAEQVPSLAQTLAADLVVMGTRRNGDPTRDLFGSVTTAVISRSAVPVLVVPQGVVFRQPKEIVLATDFQAVPGPDQFGVLGILARQFGAAIRVVHVRGAQSAAVATGTGTALENALEDLEHTYELVTDEDKVHGLEQYLAQTSPDWLVMLPHRYPVLSRIFHRSFTRHMALHACLPLLVLPGGLK
ncbi:MAG: universal stress protein [Cytophagales bacterium]|nr:universal stress protein [Cytophagales bacterium]